MRWNVYNTLHIDAFLFVGLKKKLFALVKEKDCDCLGEWAQSIVNHLYWSVVSTPSGEPDVVVAKWESVLNHVVNRHTHSNQHFPKCIHRRLRGRESQKKWIKPGKLCAETL